MSGLVEAAWCFERMGGILAWDSRSNMRHGRLVYKMLDVTWKLANHFPALKQVLERH